MRKNTSSTTCARRCTDDSGGVGIGTERSGGESVERKRKADGGDSGGEMRVNSEGGEWQQTGAEKTISGERRKHQGRDKDTRTALDRGRDRKRKDS